MKVLLVNPPLDSSITRRLGPVAAALFYNSMPLGICYLAAVLRNECNIVKIIDAPAEKLSIDDVVKNVIKFNPDAVGITSFTVSANSCYELAKQIKKNKAAAKVIIGGPHINANIGDLKDHPELDVAVLGEGELTFKELLVKISEDISKVEGIA
ncbi:MAG TPA: hypothetical protein ENN78_01155, partial [Candidatus Omnitrophica bacterium]|nr:hypothetical protein [Candidatus Omnitrophota bacterium]